MSQSTSAPEDDSVVEYEIELDEDELDQPVLVPMEAKNTRLIIRVRPRPHVFSV